MLVRLVGIAAPTGEQSWFSHRLKSSPTIHLILRVSDMYPGLRQQPDQPTEQKPRRNDQCDREHRANNIRVTRRQGFMVEVPLAGRATCSVSAINTKSACQIDPKLNNLSTTSWEALRLFLRTLT